MAPVVSPPPIARRRLGPSIAPDLDSHVVVLRGEYDCSTMDALSEALVGAIAADHADVVIDLSEVEFMDRATVDVIVRAREFLAERSRSLTLQEPSRCAARVLDLCGVDARSPRARGFATASLEGS